MKNILKNSIVLICMLISLVSFSQSSEIDFNITSENYSIAGQAVNLQSTIEKSGNTLIWTQTDSDGISEATTTQIEGTLDAWDTANTTGTLTCQLHIGTLPADFIIVGDANGLSVRMVVKLSADIQQIYIFNTNHITYP